MSVLLSVKSVRRETPGTRIVRVDLAGQPFLFDAGQAALIGPDDATDGVPYSIAISPEEARRNRELEFLIKTEASGRWGTHFPALRRGARVTVDGPVGSFAFPHDPLERHLLFIAGGTGVAPIRSMIRHALAIGYRGRIRMLYSARTPHDFAYGRELRGLARRGQIELKMTATREFEGKWRGWRGRVAAEQLASLVEDADTRCFVCGPTAMVAEIPHFLGQLGISRQRIHLEEWGP